MKKLIIIGVFIVIVIAYGLLHWQHIKVTKFDNNFRRQLAGVWLRQESDMRCTNIVAADGSFVERSWFSHPDRTNNYQRTGTWFVENGELIETVKSSSNPSEVTPHVGNAKIIQAAANKFVVRWQNSAETVWERVSQ